MFVVISLRLLVTCGYRSLPFWLPCHHTHAHMNINKNRERTREFQKERREVVRRRKWNLLHSVVVNVRVMIGHSCIRVQFNVYASDEEKRVLMAGRDGGRSDRVLADSVL